MTDAVSIRAHAKVNLFLRVLSRESTGYHGIETLFTLIDLHDELDVERIASGVELSVDGPDTGPAEENLATHAAQAVLAATGEGFGVRIRLRKRIPVRAGLGGGSSDAAAALRAVNRLAGDAVPNHEILQLASKLGADVAFFTSGAPMALAWNRGERLFRIDPPPPAPVLVAVPDVGVATPKAYQLLDAAQGEPSPRGSVVLDQEVLRSWGGIGRLGGNDFESVVWAQEPTIRELFERMAGTRPLLVRMSGSGSAIAAVYRSEEDLAQAAQAIGTKHRTFHTATKATVAPGPEARDPNK